MFSGPSNFVESVDTAFWVVMVISVFFLVLITFLMIFFVIKVNAPMWKWTFIYPNKVQSDTLYIPLKKNVRLNLNSLDVNHAFFIPAFRVKKDVIPNRNNYVWFNALETGTYEIFCAEYCGLDHSAMLAKAVVIPEQNFNFWLENKGKLAKK